MGTKNAYITLTACDSKSSDTMSCTFTINDLSKLKESMNYWFTEIPYRRYSVYCEDSISEDIETILDELEIQY